MPKPVKLPEPPTFPASNISYSKIADKMHKAALNAATSSAAIAAVTAIRDHVKGINTYSKKVRRYADDLIGALGGDKPEAEAKAEDAVPYAINDGTNSAGEPAAPKKVDTPAIPLGAAKGGDNPPDGQTYSNKSNAKRALKKLGLDHLPVTFEKVGEQVRPVVSVTDDKGAAYAAERGIAAKVLA